MKLKLINLYALLILSSSILYGMGGFEKDDHFFPSASSSSSNACSDAAQRILARSQKAQQATIFPQGSLSSNNLRSSADYDISAHSQIIDGIGQVFDIPIKHITERNVRLFAEKIQERGEEEHICIKLSRGYSWDNGGLPTTELTLDDLKLIAYYFPTMRGLDLRDTGLNLEVIRFLTQPQSFPMLEWLDISYNFKPDVDNTLPMEREAEEALKLILAPQFAPFLRRLQLMGLPISESKLKELLDEAAEAKAIASLKRYKQIRALDLTSYSFSGRMIQNELTSLMTGKYEIKTIYSRLPEYRKNNYRYLSAVMFSRDLFADQQLISRMFNYLYKGRLERVLKKHKTPHSSFDNDKGKKTKI